MGIPKKYLTNRLIYDKIILTNTAAETAGRERRGYFYGTGKICGIRFQLYIREQG